MIEMLSWHKHDRTGARGSKSIAELRAVDAARITVANR
jgi:hypothetical protein